MQSFFDDEMALSWTEQNMPITRSALQKLPPLEGVRLGVSTHLDIKMIPAFRGLLEKGAQLFLTTCNPDTVRNEVVQTLEKHGAHSQAWKGMSAQDYKESLIKALQWNPTHICEFGASLTSLSHQFPELGNPSAIQGSVEGTSTGIAALNRLNLKFPVLNWNDVRAKEGLHNRFAVGLITSFAFLNRTRLTFHGKNVLILGYGSVGRGMADAARAFGGSVTIAEKNTSRALEAQFRGWPCLPLEKALPEADVVISATGVAGVLSEGEISKMKDGAFLINIGHSNDEIDLQFLSKLPQKEVLPYVREILLDHRKLYLFADGSMANLVAADGDSLNTFDITSAIMVCGIAEIITKTGKTPLLKPGVHVLSEARINEYLN